MKTEFTWEEYLENIRKIGCCPCGYRIHDWLSTRTHWELHKKNGSVKNGKLVIPLKK